MESVLIQFKKQEDAQKFIKTFDLIKHGAASATAHQEAMLAKLYIDIAILRGDVIELEKHASVVKKLEAISSVLNGELRSEKP